MIETIFTILRGWRLALRDRDCPPDPFRRLGPRELADLPVYHPPKDK